MVGGGLGEMSLVELANFMQIGDETKSSSVSLKASPSDQRQEYKHKGNIQLDKQLSGSRLD